jgi:hydrogenase maturation protein HypF
MVQDVAWARRVAKPTAEEELLLQSRRRPIVLLHRKEQSPVAPSVAPGSRFLGVMLPYTPLHSLLSKEAGRPIVLTSGNVSDEPIAFDDGDAFERLAPLAGHFLTHSRPIHIRCDDSVTRVVGEREYPIRRSRGYAPDPIIVSAPFRRPVLAAGPELKHTFCVGVEDRAILSHHIGDLETFEAMSAFLSGVEHFTRVFDVHPEVVTHDLHPDYLSTKWAEALAGVEKVGVQHHHAHIVSCMADNGREEKVIGLALDGTGFGADGRLWGCEVLLCDLADFQRCAHLRYVAMPGGAAAIREPWRMAAAYLDEAFGDDASQLPLEVIGRRGDSWGPIVAMARADVNAPLTSGAGRLFDAAAALCGIRDQVSYEGQAAAELEQAADPSVMSAYPCPLSGGVIDGVELIACLANDLTRGADVPTAAARFHNGLAAALVQACEAVRETDPVDVVALSGGAFQNILLVERVRRGLHRAGFEVLLHHRVPANDGGISLGQVMVANARLSRS